MSAANTLKGEIGNRRTESPFTETQADAHVLSSSEAWSEREGAMTMAVAASPGTDGWSDEEARSKTEVTGEQSSPLLAM